MTRLRLLLLPLLILAAALSITWLVWDHERQSSRKALRSQFDFALREASSRVDQRMAAYEQMLRGVQGLFAASGKMDRHSFRDYVGSLQLDANFAGIEAIGVAEWVPAARYSAHLDAMRRLGGGAYAIRPGGPRDAFAPVIQVEPRAMGDRSPLGFDPWSDPVRRLAMEKARDSGMPAITGKTQLALDNEAQPGFVMYLPIFERGYALSSVSARRDHLVGWVFAAFRMQDLMASLYGEQLPGLKLAIYDGVDASAAALLYQSDELSDRRSPSALAANEYLVVAGHSWMLSLSTRSDFEARYGRNSEALIAVAGTGLSLLLALLAWMLVTGRARATRLAITMTRELRASEQRWGFALEGAGDGVWDWNLQTRETVNSRRLQEIVGADDHDGDSIDRWEQRIHPDDMEKYRDSMQTYLAAAPDASVSCVAEYRIRTGDGRWKWILSRGMVVERDAEGRPLRIIGTLTDIGDRKRMEEQVRQLAFHDPLTNLPNRRLLSDRLSQAMAVSQRTGRYGALMFLDLDNFKPLNDRYGHEVGDLLLIEAADRLKRCVREIDTVTRFGGDEFVVMIRELETLSAESCAEAGRIAEKIRSALSQPYFLTIRRGAAAHQIVEHQCTASIGLALFIGQEATQDDILKRADTAMYQAKVAGRDRVHLAPQSLFNGAGAASTWPHSSAFRVSAGHDRP